MMVNLKLMGVAPWDRQDLTRIIAADAILRRLGAALLAAPHDASIQVLLAGPERQSWQDYLEAAFLALADGRPAPTAAPDAPGGSTLNRVRRGIELLSAGLFGGSSQPGQDG